MKYVKAFGEFLWEFLVSDTPEITVGVLVILALAIGVHSYHMTAVIGLPIAVIALLLFSLRRGIAEHNRPRP